MIHSDANEAPLAAARDGATSTDTAPASYAPTVPTRRVALVTLGCAKNEVDSDRMRALIETCPAFEVVDDPQGADVVVVNTCSFLVAAVQEGIELTLEMLGLTLPDGTSTKVVMTGCIPSRYGEQVVRELPEVAAFLPVDREDAIVEVLARVTGLGSVQTHAPRPADVLRTVRSATAYVKISDGCDRFCSFCAIPYIRGGYYSRPAEEILAEVRALVDGGVREIVLIGQDTGVWGHDLAGSPTLSWLMRQAAQVLRPVRGWLRVLYLQPEGMDRELVDTIREVPEVVPYIDLPLQHCDARALARMNRTGDADQFRQLIARLRSEIPGMTVRTTAMAGFPGETDQEFEELYDFLSDVGFDYTAVFAYSQEEGTSAAQLPDQVDEETKLERTQRLQDLADAAGFASAQRRVGQVVRVLVDGHEQDDEGNVELIGRASFQAPDSDGVVHLGQAEATVGEFVQVAIDEAVCYELFGTIVSHEGPATGDE